MGRAAATGTMTSSSPPCPPDDAVACAADAKADLDGGVPRIIAGKYRLVRPIGSGGMGAVWVARNEATGAEVALKVLLEENGSSALVERLRREAHATASLSHRGIVRVYDLVDCGPTGGQLAIVMELLRGRTLADHMDERGALPVDEAVAILLPMLSALAHAHARGVTHRDLKPENVFLSVDSDGVVTPKILDFGISKLRVPDAPVITHQGELLGTPSYMSPEQVRGSEDIDGRSDLFAVGVLLYEIISGKNPFCGSDVRAVLALVLEGRPPRIDEAPPEIWSVIERALQKDPGQRFSTATEFAHALRSAIGIPEARESCPSPDSYPPIVGAQEPAYRPSVVTPAPPTPSARWAVVASSIGAAVVGALVAAGLAIWTPSASARAEVTTTGGQMTLAPSFTTTPSPIAMGGADAVLARVVDDPVVEGADAGSTATPIPSPMPTPRVTNAAPSRTQERAPAPTRHPIVAREPGF